MKKSKAENLGVKASFGLKQKILFPAIGLLVLTVCIILALVLPLSSQKAMELSSDLMVSMSKQYANDVQGKLNAAWNSAKALSPVFSQFGRNTSRTTDTNLLEIVLEQNDDLFGTFTIWEPDAYDGIDSLYVNSKYSDETGRFIPYVHHGDGDEVVIEPMPDYETEGAGDYYLVPKNTMEETVVDPFYSDVGGRQVMISSMVVPLIRSNEFVGVVGMDILVDTLVKDLKGAALFDTGYLFMADSDGTIFYHPSASVIGQSLYGMWNDEHDALLTEALNTGETKEFDEFSAELGYYESRYIITPVSLGDRHWLVCAVAPVSEINAATATTLTVGFTTGIIGAVAAAVILLVIISRITQPIDPLTKAAAAIELGQVDSNVTESLAKIKSKDEIGLLARSIEKAVGAISLVATDVRTLSDATERNDLSVTIDTTAHKGIYQEVMRVVNSIVEQFNHTLHSINTAAEQVNTGASQVSSGAQALAAGSTEQASSVEELNASVVIIAEHAAKNDTNVKIANNFVEQADEGVAASNDHMRQLSAAMEEIGSASGQIANITKVIEDIAFQTNILALNAAIEAARAGEAGKGFAVVADEVRTLAAKSAEAAKKTADLIQNSVDTVARGTQLTAQTAEILQAVGESTRKVTESFGKIEQASAEQAGAIEQVKQGLSQVSAVVQTNAATAEENSATSEEMSAQAATLRDEVGKFKLDTRGASAAFQPQEATPRVEALPQNGPAQEDFLLADGQADSDLGKY